MRRSLLVGLALAMAMAPVGEAAASGSDLFANRSNLGSAATVNTTGSNVGFTGEVGEPPQSGAITSAWWQWTAAANGTVTIDTFGSNLDTFLTVATGAAVNALTVLAQNDDAGGSLQSEIVFDAIAGTTYQIAVDGFQSNTGNIALNINLEAVVGTCGDLNGDGDINVFDAILELQFIVGLVVLSEEQLRLGDVVRDGTINVFDAILMLQHIVGLTEITDCGLVEPTGKGVTVVILDRGIDWRHPDFINEDGSTRIKWILDMTGQQWCDASNPEPQKCW